MYIDDSADRSRAQPCAAGWPAYLHWRYIGLVVIGGTFGTAARFALTEAVPTWSERAGGDIRRSTSSARSCSGCSWPTLARRGRDEGSRRAVRLLLGTGFLGGFTTYSTLAVETDALVRSGQAGLAVAYAVTTVIVGALAAAAGIRVASRRQRQGRWPVILTLVLVSVAGGLGAAARLVLDGVISARFRFAYPVGTTVINVTGSLLLGLITGLAISHGMPEQWHLILGSGFLGGYTTFSTASFETVRLLQAGRYPSAVVNGLGMLVLSVLAAAAGLWLGSL